MVPRLIALSFAPPSFPVALILTRTPWCPNNGTALIRLRTFR